MAGHAERDQGADGRHPARGSREDLLPQRDQGLQPLTTVLGDRLRAAASSAPYAVAFVDGARRITYAEWDRLSDAAAATLARAGIRHGDVVALMLPTVASYPIAYLGAAKLGAITAGINPRLAAPEVERLIGLSGARIALSDRQLSITTLPVAALAEQNDPPPVVAVAPDDPVALIFTSGTTGSPKAATYTHQALDAIARIESQMDHEDAPVRLQSIPMAHMQFMTKVAFAIDTLATTVLMPTWTAHDALATIERERITSFGGIPTQLQLMLRDRSFETTDLSSLRACTLGGAPADAALVEQVREAFGVPVFVRYSCTELGVITGTRADDPTDVVANTVGRPLPEVEIVIADADPDGIGEVAARNPGMMRGYWGEEPVDGLFSTGDLGRVDPDGNLRLVGRRKEMYIRGGYNVYPVEVEAVLGAHPQVAQVAVVGIADPVLGERGKAVVVPAGEAPTLDELRAFAAEQIADYKLPDLLEIRDELPLNTMFKVDKEALRSS